MSVQNIAWVIRYSPYRGTNYALHLALADSSNDVYENQVWMALETLGAKARQSRRSVIAGLKRLCDDGFLKLVSPQRGPAGAARYRMIFPDGLPVVYDSPEGRRTRAKAAPEQSQHPCKAEHEQVQEMQEPVQNSSAIPLYPTQEIPTDPKNRAKTSKLPARVDAMFEAIVTACRYDRASLNKPSRAAIANAAKALRESNIDPSEVTRLAELLTARWSDSAVTPASLAKHAPLIGEVRHPTQRRSASRPNNTGDRNLAAIDRAVESTFKEATQ